MVKWVAFEGKTNYVPALYIKEVLVKLIHFYLLAE